MSVSTRLSRVQVVAICALILSVAVFRVVRAVWLPELPNFSPVLALAFCGGVFLPGLLAWILPAAAVLLADVGLAIALGYAPFGSWQIGVLAGLAAAVLVGRWIASRDAISVGGFFALLTATGVGFYLLTNAATWVVSPEYAKTPAGFLQAQTVGLPGLPPAWTFLRNALASDLLFGGLILAVRALAGRLEFTQPVHIEVRNHPRPSGLVR